MRERSDLKRLRAAIILVGIVALSLQWSIREDPCARQPTLEIVVVNELPHAADVVVTVVDGRGPLVFQGTYHLGAGEATSTGPIEVDRGLYIAAAQVEGDGAESQVIGVDACGASAVIAISPDRITIVRSEDV